MKMKNLKKVLMFAIIVAIVFLPAVNAFRLFPSTGTGSDVSGGSGCPLGTKVTKDLIGVLNAFRIAGPLLMIGFTIMETVKALTQGDGQAEMKKVFNRLKKRFMYVVLLIFVPTLVKVGLAAMGITDGCDLQVTDNQVDTGGSHTMPTNYTKGVQYDDKSYYERVVEAGE
jgi:hypothetical protein